MGKNSLSFYLTSAVMETLKCYCWSAILASGVLLTVSPLLSYSLLYYMVGVFFLTSIFVPVVKKWIPKDKISPKGKAVFISGCDTGFGHLLAQRLDDLGFHVFAGCLFPDGDGATELKKSCSNRLHVVGLDVTSDTSVETAAAYVKENLNYNELWAVVNNAGINLGGELHWTNIDAMQKVLEVNTFGVVRLTKAFLSKLKESKGRVITMASAAGRYTFPGMVPYCMSKSATINFCDGLRLEMYKWNIQFVTIEPWMYRTAILDEERTAKNLRQTWEKASEDVKNMYNPNFIETHIKRALRVIRETARDNPNEVVTLMEDSITALHPEYSYSVGDLASRFSLWVLQRVPKPVADLLIFYFMMSR